MRIVSEQQLARVLSAIDDYAIEAEAPLESPPAPRPSQSSAVIGDRVAEVIGEHGGH